MSSGLTHLLAGAMADSSGPWQSQPCTREARLLCSTHQPLSTWSSTQPHPGLADQHVELTHAESTPKPTFCGSISCPSQDIPKNAVVPPQPLLWHTAESQLTCWWAWRKPWSVGGMAHSRPQPPTGSSLHQQHGFSERKSQTPAQISRPEEDVRGSPAWTGHKDPGTPEFSPMSFEEALGQPLGTHLRYWQVHGNTDGGSTKSCALGWGRGHLKQFLPTGCV